MKQNKINPQKEKGGPWTGCDEWGKMNREMFSSRKKKS